MKNTYYGKLNEILMMGDGFIDKIYDDDLLDYFREQISFERESTQGTLPNFILESEHLQIKGELKESIMLLEFQNHELQRTIEDKDHTISHLQSILNNNNISY